MIAQLNSSAEQPALYPVIHQDLGKAVPAWLYPSLGKKWWISADLGEFWLGNQNLTHRGVFQTQIFHSNRSGQLFHPSGDSSKTTNKRSKASKCDPKLPVWSELTKLDLNPCFPQGAGSLLLHRQSSQEQTTKRKLLEKRPCCIYQQPFQWPYFGTSEFFHHEEGIISFVIIVIVVIRRGGSFCPLPGQSSSSSGIKGIHHDWLRAFDLTAAERTTLAFWFLQGTGESCHCSPWGAQIVTCFVNNQLLTCFLAGSFQLRGRQRQTGLETWNIFSLK